ncbi:necrosis inducing protein [Colletotrichum graminicola]|uniref:Necrosis inducing protein n=1 Tax=Colletotrichum graminicola (strain M1.001 / M2 / FGSC 10212) TaxID=645133 RepID=E3QH14_COLGM|nr:necrosis inducing protein [Colletotrichum graminicola M1.001]EFQ30176.1 necrosis inducing protein [Colletotrichum graminicola M1.001]WDK09161.1 necrosis inducing protein [Colletotrichum graminicola]
MFTGTLLVAWGLLWTATAASPIGHGISKTAMKHAFPLKINECAPEADKKWQPALDFDTDSCYNTPAVDRDGTLNAGMGVCETWSTAGRCRDRSDLENSNVYSRARCNNGWCAYMYGYYFEKDQISPCLGHINDWEHVVVFVRDGVPEYVSASAHGRYERRAWRDLFADGTHAKIVYHKDGPGTHAFRFAKAADDMRQENHHESWFYGDLIGWNGFPSTAVRDKMTSKSWGKAKIDFTDERFKDSLELAIVGRGREPRDIDMRTDVDDGSPGMSVYCPKYV